MRNCRWWPISAPRSRRARRSCTRKPPGNVVYDWTIGDEAATNAAFKAAANVVSLDITNNRLVPNAMEPRAAIAEYDDAEEHFTLYTTSQNPHVARLVLSAFYNIAPEHKLRVIAPDVGGGFGSKIFIYPEEMVALWASKKVRRPVKWTADRTEAFLTDAHGRDHLSKAEMAFDKDNKIIGLRVKTHANLGAYMSLFSSSVPTYLYATLLSGQYNIPNIFAEVIGVYTNTTPVDAYRGAGRPEASFLVERLMETAARQLKVDPAELRRKNFITTFPHQTPVIMAYDVGDFDASLDSALKAIDYAGFAARKEKAKNEGKLRGIGVSCYIEACGIAPSKAVGSLGAGVGLWESAEVRVNPVGTIEILTGSHSHGQGHETTFAQVVADRLGIPISQVSIVHGDTDKVQFGMGTYGSRSAAVGISAIVKAMEKVEAKAKKIVSHQLEASENDIVIENGNFKVTGTDKSMALANVALAAYTAHNLPAGMEPGLKEGAFYDPTNFTFPAGAYICEVEVDAGTGKTSFVNFVAADDFGTLINPMIVEGQVHGGLAQGIGQALLEGTVYDRTGQLITASFMDYAMPRADDLPSFKLSHTTTLCPGNPLGVKGCGEAGAIGASAAVINAITDAIGNNKLEMPATPDGSGTRFTVDSSSGAREARTGICTVTFEIRVRARSPMTEPKSSGRNHVCDHLSSPLERRRSRRPVRQGLGGKISRRRPHAAAGDEAAAGLAVGRDRPRQDPGAGRHRGHGRHRDRQGGDHLLRHPAKRRCRRRSRRSCTSRR